MSESPALHYSSTVGQTSLVRVGGGLGIASTSICLAIFVLGCFGFSAAFVWLPLIPLLMAGTGAVFTIVGATLKKSPLDEDTQVFAAMFCSFLGLGGAFVELAIGFNWNVFYQQGV